MLLKDFIRESSESLTGIYPIEEAQSVIFMLCAFLLGTQRHTHIVEPEYSIPEDKLDLLEKSVCRLKSGEPVQYVIGKAEFCSHSFNVGEGVLIPRPETEFLVSKAVQLRPSRVLDMCTGSGCIAWSLAAGLAGCGVVGVDISDAALEYAVGQDIPIPEGHYAPVFLKMDVLKEPCFSEGEKFDMIISNPPYIKESEKSSMRINVLGFEPCEALFVPDEDPLVFYRAVKEWSDILLVPGGYCLVEINETLAVQTAEIFGQGSVIAPDFLGKDRYVIYKKP